MNRRERKLERRRKERAQRHRELAARKHAREGVLASPMKLESTDMRGTEESVWSLLGDADRGGVLRRAQMIWPEDRLLRKLMQGKLIPTLLRDPVLQEMSALLTHAARTLRCDPPWSIPYADVARIGRDVRISITVSYPDIERDPMRGRFAHWKLERPHPGGRTLKIWFTAHAVERLGSRLAIDAPVWRRYLADSWSLLLGSFEFDAGLRVVRRIEQRPSGTVLTFVVEAPDGTISLGYSPLEIDGERAVAKTFLEPWMPLGGPDKLPAKERDTQHETFRRDVLPRAHEAFKAFALRGLRAERTQPVVNFLARTMEAAALGGAKWMPMLRSGLAAVDQGRAAEARALLERGLNEHEEAWAQWTDELRKAWSMIPSAAYDVARGQLELADLLGHAADSAPPETAPALRERAGRLRAAALAAEPSLGDGDGPAPSTPPSAAPAITGTTS